MKKTCFGCRAETTGGCELGYKTKIRYVMTIASGFIPCESCPKPRTYSELFRERKKATKKGTTKKNERDLRAIWKS